MKINIISISDSDKDFKFLVDEYCKRLGKEMNIVNIKPDKSSEIEKIKKNDTDKIIKNLEKNTDYKILMSIKGQKLSTENFAKIIEKQNNITFIIGGPYGLNEDEISKFIDVKISISDMTFPHGLAKVILLEQIFRAKTILENRSYHY